MEGRKPPKVAEIEAFQEADIKGVMGRKLSFYPYNKVMPDGTERLCVVEVYPRRMTAEAKIWPESSDRERAWFSAREAISLMDEGGSPWLSMNGRDSSLALWPGSMLQNFLPD